MLTFLASQDLDRANDLQPLGSGPGWLPLRDRRLLAAITAQLHGTWFQGLVARLPIPSHFRALQGLVNDRATWQPSAVAAQDADARASAERDKNRSCREKGSLTPDEVTALVAAQARDSILLNRLWPPGAAATGNSWLGGLPCLPDSMDWPRSRVTGLPLHFLAHIDCADLPTLGGISPLPRDGLFLFFSDLGKERINEDGDGRNAVVHPPKDRQTSRTRALPDDLPEINHAGGKPSIYSEEPGKRHYPKWPVQPVAVKIWSGESREEPRSFNLDDLKQSRAAHDASLAAVMPPAASGSDWAGSSQPGQARTPTGRSSATVSSIPPPFPSASPSAGRGPMPSCGGWRCRRRGWRAARPAAGR